MREVIEFRVAEEFASLLFDAREGTRLGDSIRKVQLEGSDLRIHRVAELQAELRQTAGKPFFYGWRIRRIYTATELAKAALLRLGVSNFFEPTGEECGTKYDDSSACSQCGAGATQVGPLILDTGRIPTGKDFAQTIGREIVVSRRTRDVLTEANVTGVALTPVHSRRGSTSDKWFQLVPLALNAIVAPPTVVGIDPVDTDDMGRERCPKGDLLGLNLLSEVSIRADSRVESDVIASQQFIGVRRGLVRPARIVMVSPKVWRVAMDSKLKGCEFEVAHVV